MVTVLLSSFAKPAAINGKKADSAIHNIDSRLVGKWMWTRGNSGAYYDNNGTYKGSAYGFATQYNIGTDGMVLALVTFIPPLALAAALK